MLRQSHTCRPDGEITVGLSMLQIFREYGLEQLEINGEKPQPLPMYTQVKTPVAEPKSLVAGVT